MIIHVSLLQHQQEGSMLSLGLLLAVLVTAVGLFRKGEFAVADLASVKDKW